MYIYDNLKFILLVAIGTCAVAYFIHLAN